MEIDERLWSGLKEGAAPKTSIANFLSRVRIEDDGCWRWLGWHAKRGGKSAILRVFFGGTETTAQRVSWRLWRGEVPSSRFVNRKCANEFCVNPEHLYLSARPNNESFAIRRLFAAREGRGGDGKN